MQTVDKRTIHTLNCSERRHMSQAILKRQLRVWILLGIVTLPAIASAGSPTLVELMLGETAYQGTSLWHDDHICALMRTDGSIVHVPLSDVTSFRQVSPRFRSMGTAELQARLRREFGTLQVESAGNSIVVAPSGMARQLAELHHDTWSVYQDYFRRRGFDVSRTEMPFVTVVYPTFAEFAQVSEEHRVPVSPTLKGYYHAMSNRIIMYVPSEVSQSTGPTELLVSEDAYASIDDVGLMQTLAHEAVHQFGFNTGLHRRIGSNPRWIVEGLAMQFEGESGLASNSSTQQQRMNRDRFVRFTQGVMPQQSPQLISALLTGDALFEQAPLDAYALSWALTFYLIETQRADFVEYMQVVAALPPDERWSGTEAIGLFEDSFGDLADVNSSFVRFMQSLNR